MLICFLFSFVSSLRPFVLFSFFLVIANCLAGVIDTATELSLAGWQMRKNVNRFWRPPPQLLRRRQSLSPCLSHVLVFLVTSVCGSICFGLHGWAIWCQLGVLSPASLSLWIVFKWWPISLRFAKLFRQLLKTVVWNIVDTRSIQLQSILWADEFSRQGSSDSLLDIPCDLAAFKEQENGCWQNNGRSKDTPQLVKSEGNSLLLQKKLSC